MTDQAKRSDLLQRRLAAVAGISALTAEALKLTQALAGVEMDVLRHELEIARSGASDKLVQDLHEANKNAAELEAAKADCDQRIDAAEGELSDIDRALAAIANA